MAGFAYRDAARSNRLDANNATNHDKGKNFFCPNKNCTAILTIRSLGNNPYFSAKKTTPHINGCTYATFGNNYHEYNEKLFNFNDLIDGLCTQSKVSSSASKHSSTKSPSASSSQGEIRTLKLFCAMCKDKKIDDTYNGMAIGIMLLDDRSISKYHSKGVFSKKVIECESIRYDDNNKEIWLSISHYKIILVFNDDNIYKKIRNVIWNNSPSGDFKNVQVAIAGDWSKYKNKSNHFQTTIISEKQIILL